KRLQDDRSGEHQAGNADASRRDRQEGRLALRLCREFARASGRPGKHTLLELPGAAHRALRLLHHGLLPHASRLLPVLRRQYSRTVGYRVSRADYCASFRAPLASAVKCPPSADLLRSYADRSLPSPAAIIRSPSVAALLCRLTAMRPSRGNLRIRAANRLYPQIGRAHV